MRAAILFPGQGAQYVGMGKELYENNAVAKEVFDLAADILDWDIKEVCFKDENGLINQTRYTQAALFTTNYAVYKVLEKAGLKADAMIGFSLGEYDALVASGAIGFEQAVALIDKRGSYMDQAAAANQGGMSAVIGLDADIIREICESITTESISNKTNNIVEVANDNCIGQVTIAGTKEGMEAASDKLKLAGAKRVIPLKVSGAFHSSLMNDAKIKMQKEVEAIRFAKPKNMVISNVTARQMDADEIKANIPTQIVKGVRFRESIEYLLQEGFDTFIEVGPKCTLSNLVKKISSEVNIYQAEDIESIKALLEKVGIINA